MRTNDELNRLAAAATQATAQIYLGNDAALAVRRAALNSGVQYDAQMEGLFKSLKKVVNKGLKLVRKAAPIAAQFIPGAGPMVAAAITAYQTKREQDKEQDAYDTQVRSENERYLKELVKAYPMIDKEKAAALINAGDGAGLEKLLAATVAQPVPPTDINSPEFAKWATALGAQNPGATGNNTALTDPEKELLYAKIQSLQTQAVTQLPSQPQFYPMPQVPVPVQQAMQEKAAGISPVALLAIGAPLAILLMSKKR